MSERAAELAILKKLSLHGDGLSAEEKREREELRVLEKQIASAWIKRELISEAEFASQCGASVEFACL